MEKFDVVIIGLGPGGIALGLDLIDKGVKFTIIEKGMPGGKVNIAPRVDNYPNHDKIDGPSLAMELFMGANKAGLPIKYDEVVSLEKDGDIFVLKLLDETIAADYVVVASGTKERKLGLDREDYFLGKGLSYCALCDGHFFKGQDVAVIGGGDSAFKEAIHLAPIVNHLYLIHRRNEFRADAYLVDELKAFDNVTFLTPFRPIELLGDDHINGLKIVNNETEKEKIVEICGVFPLVGQDPNTEFIHIEGALDAHRSIPVNKDMESPIKNLYAIGDVTDVYPNQIYIAEDDAHIVSKNLLNKLLK